MSIRLKKKGNMIYLNEHYLLNGLDRPNQHPITAIIGLREELNEKYIKPDLGIPDSHLQERYLKKLEFDKEKHSLLAKCAEFRSDIDSVNEKLEVTDNRVDSNAKDVLYVKNQLEIIKNMINSLPPQDQVCGGSTHIKQEIFTSTEDNRVFDIAIVDTDMRVIEPTILKVENGNTIVAVLDRDYTISYPNDELLRITFLINGDFRINYISGSVTENEFNILLEYIKKLESSINTGMAGSGAILRPNHNIELVYDGSKVVKEIYTGDVDKTVSYEYDSNDNIIKKTVTQDGIIKVATYLYDLDGNLIQVEDNGTEIPVNGTAPLKYLLDIEYDTNGFVSKETYTGGVNKVITYTNNIYGDVVSKSVDENGRITRADYTYDSNRNLISVSDSGTEKVAIVFPEATNCNCSGNGGSGSVDVGAISNQEIDLIFDTIFS